MPVTENKWKFKNGSWAFSTVQSGQTQRPYTPTSSSSCKSTVFPTYLWLPSAKWSRCAMAGIVNGKRARNIQRQSTFTAWPTCSICCWRRPTQLTGQPRGFLPSWKAFFFTARYSPCPPGDGSGTAIFPVTSPYQVTLPKL